MGKFSSLRCESVFFVAEITCSSPLTSIQIPYGYIDCQTKDVYTEGDFCQHQCDEGYGLSGSSELFCVADTDIAAGKWNNTVFPCQGST